MIAVKRMKRVKPMSEERSIDLGQAAKGTELRNSSVLGERAELERNPELERSPETAKRLEAEKNAKLGNSTELGTSTEPTRGRKPITASATEKTSQEEQRSFPVPYLLVEDISHSFDRFKAPEERQMVLKDIDFRIYPKQFTALVGESGSGKTTLARIISGQLRPLSGHIYLNGREISQLTAHQRRKARLGMQMVFQDPYSSLHPLQKIGRQMEEPLLVQGQFSREERRRKVEEMLAAVGLDPEVAERFPQNLSGGQRQRAAIGCALITRPQLLIADEPVSALDLSVQAQILNLFQRLRRDFDFACLFISHDLDVVRYLCDRVAVLHDGVIVEEDKAQRLFAGPRHPYTQQLLSASLSLED